MSNTILPVQRAFNESRYFAQLQQARPISIIIADQLKVFSPAGARSIRNCGRYPIGTAAIELVNGAHGLFVRGIKWCGSRFCPICQPRIMAVLGSKRAARARAAKAAGLGVAFAQFGQPHGAAGELQHLLEAHRADWSATWPTPSGLSNDWKDAALTDWLGLDYNIEIDWNAVSGNWHVHAHALAWRRSKWCTESLDFLRSCWPHSAPLAWAEVADSPEAAARYSVKLENEKPELMSLFDLARLEQVQQVAEYLQVVQGVRLRATSRALSGSLKLRSNEAETKLLEAANKSPGEVVEWFTVGDWLRRW